MRYLIVVLICVSLRLLLMYLLAIQMSSFDMPVKFLYHCLIISLAVIFKFLYIFWIFTYCHTHSLQLYLLML